MAKWIKDTGQCNGVQVLGRRVESQESPIRDVISQYHEFDGDIYSKIHSNTNVRIV